MNVFRRARRTTTWGLVGIVVAGLAAILHTARLRRLDHHSSVSAKDPDMLDDPDKATLEPAADIAHGDVPASALSAYEEADSEWGTNARTRITMIVMLALFLGLLAFMIELNSTRDPRILPSSRQSMGALVRVSESLGELGRRDILSTMLAMLGLQITTAIALSTTAIDPAATARVVVATERWLNTLRAASQLLAGAVCFVAAAFGIAGTQQHAVPPGAPIVLVMTILSCLLGSAMVDRTNALVSQVGILVQIGRVRMALDRLHALPQVRRRVLSVMQGALWPSGVLILSAAVVEVARGHGISVTRQLVAALALWALFGASLAWVRWGAARSAASWAIGYRFGTKKLLAVSYGTIIVIGVVWLPIALVVTWHLTANDLWRGGLILLTYVWPMAWLVKDASPRWTRADTAAEGRRYQVRPSPAAAASAERSLRQQHHRLDGNLTKWRSRVRNGSLGVTFTFDEAQLTESVRCS